MKQLNKSVAMLMVIFMVITMIPFSAFATEQEQNSVLITNVTDTIKATLSEGTIQKGSRKTFDVIARDVEGNKIDSQVTLNGEAIAFNWDDCDKTSYTLKFSKTGENTVVITAGNAKVIYNLNYQPAQKGEVIGTATWCVEGFSINKGYFVKPIQMDIYEGYNAAYHLEKLLTENGLRFDYTGSLDGSFYIAGLYDGSFNKSSMWERKRGGYYISSSPIITTAGAISTSPGAIGIVPNSLNLTLNNDGKPDITLLPEVKNLINKGFNTNFSCYGRDDENGNYGLGEFDFTNGSGWMYCLNNVFPNVGFADSYPADGDVFRVQFTLAYGSDIGGASAMGGGSGTPKTSEKLSVANKDNLIRAIAKKGYENVSAEYISIAENLLSSQNEVDSATEAILGDVAINDIDAPVISEIKSERFSNSEAKIYFNSDENGTVYYQLVDKNSTDIDIDSTALNTALTAGENTINISNIVDSKAKDLYVIAKDKNNNYSCAYRVPIAEMLDIVAPSISDICETRVSADSATIEFTSDEAGTYKYIIVDKDAKEPTFDENMDSYLLNEGKNSFTVDNLSDSEAKDIYIFVVDTLNNSHVYKSILDKYIGVDIAIVDKAMNHLDKTLEFMVKAIPAPIQQTIAGDWTVMTLARAEYTVPDGYYEAWKNIVNEKMINMKGALHRVKYTEYSRLMLPLNALGYDPTDVGGYNILEKYANFNTVKKQGLNGPLWALIALDTGNYEIDKDALASVSESQRNSRERMIQFILSREITDKNGIVGGCALCGKTPDPDMTAMAIQSLAPYYNKDNVLLKAEFKDNIEEYEKLVKQVKGFVDRGLAVLSKLQREDGDYSSWGSVNSESTAQVLVALLSLNIDPMNDYRFIKNGKSLINGIMKYAVDGGGFAHTFSSGDAGYDNGGGNVNLMATDQSGYALVAYKRFVEGKTYLYDMTDVKRTERPDTFAPNIFYIKSERIDEANAKITFIINEPGVYWYSIDNKNVDTSVEGVNNMTVEKNTNNIIELNIDNLSDNKQKTLYFVSRDICGNENKLPIEIIIPAVDGADEVAPVISNIDVKRISKTTAEVCFNSDEEGMYYYEVVNSKEQKPVIDITKEGYNMLQGKNTISLTNLNNEIDQVIYIAVKDLNNNFADDYIKINIQKFSEGSSEADKYAKERAAAKSQLTKVFGRCSKNDYTEENWLLVIEAYHEGLKSIDDAKPSDEKCQEIYDALNLAVDIIYSIPLKVDREVTVCVSMDANTLGLGYLIKPTLVRVSKYEKASVVLTDLLRENGYTWENTGSINDSFYLAQVKPVNQKEVKIADYILNVVGENSILYEDMNDTDLGEFDYYNMSGWMYSISDGTQYPSFPGVGAASWCLMDKEVMRWQFTVYGYGADLNADNSLWGAKSIVPNLGDKTDLTWLVAALRDKYSDDLLESNKTYSKAMDILTNPQAGQRTINSILNQLRKVDFEKLENQISQTTNGEGESINIKVEIDDDKAIANISDKDATKILENAKENKLKEIIVNLDSSKNVGSKVEKTVLNVPNSMINDIYNETLASMTIKTENISINISHDALSSLSAKTEGNASITISKVNNTMLSDENKKLVENNPVYDLSVSADDRIISNFNGDITVAISFTAKKSQYEDCFNVYYIDDGGNATIVRNAIYNAEDKKMVFKTKHFSKYALVYDEFNNTFNDVKETFWFYQYVRFAFSKDILNGVSENRFNPEDKMTRAMLVTALYRINDDIYKNQKLNFSDVKADEWYTDAIAWAYENNIVTGYSDSKFGTNDSITREQIIAILYRYAELKKYNTDNNFDLSEFSDKSEISSYTVDAMKWALENGIISGRTKTTLCPKDSASRAEVAAMLARFMKNTIK